jgi:hypothetical protein
VTSFETVGHQLSVGARRGEPGVRIPREAPDADREGYTREEIDERLGALREVRACAGGEERQSSRARVEVL